MIRFKWEWNEVKWSKQKKQQEKQGKKQKNKKHYLSDGIVVFAGNERKQRCRNRPAHNCTPIIPKMKKTKKQSNNTLPSI